MYTPGPWKIEGEIWNIPDFDYGCLVCRRMGFEYGDEVTTIETEECTIAQLSRPHPASEYIEADNRTNSEIRANAELIAAAPDMYEALGNMDEKLRELNHMLWNVLPAFDNAAPGNLDDKIDIHRKMCEILNIMDIYSKLKDTLADNE